MRQTGTRKVTPNLAVNRTPAGGAGYGERLVGAGYLTRWAAQCLPP